MEGLYKEYAKIYDIIYYKEALYRKEVDYIESIAPPPLKILDLCGGTGSHANLLINDGYDVTIVDRSDSMLKIAQQKNKRIKTVCSDIFQFEFDGEYDIILCMYGAIHYTNDLNQIKCLIERLLYHLNPGGKVLFDLRYSDNLPEDNGLEINNGWWNRKFWKRKKGVDGSDIYVVTAFNKEHHFLEVHNLYHCDPFLFRDMFLKGGFAQVDLYDGYTKTPFIATKGGNVVVLVASC